MEQLSKRCRCDCSLRAGSRSAGIVCPGGYTVSFARIASGVVGGGAGVFHCIADHNAVYGRELVVSEEGPQHIGLGGVWRLN